MRALWSFIAESLKRHFEWSESPGSVHAFDGDASGERGATFSAAACFNVDTELSVDNESEIARVIREARRTYCFSASWRPKKVPDGKAKRDSDRH